MATFSSKAITPKLRSVVRSRKAGGVYGFVPLGPENEDVQPHCFAVTSIS
jgi:hypothetical protein